MPKKIRYESAVYLFLVEAKKITEGYKSSSITKYNKLKKFIDSLSFENMSKDVIKISWKYPEINATFINIGKAKLYFRGDNQTFMKKQNDFRIEKDIIKIQNSIFFNQLVIDVIKDAKL